MLYLKLSNRRNASRPACPTDGGSGEGIKMAITIYLNGKKEEIEENISISNLLEVRRIRPEVVTVELNNTTIKREEYSSTTLKNQDQVEFVYFMGGGREWKQNLKEMQSGQILEVILDPGEPIKNMPRSVKEEGHRILQVEKTGSNFRLNIEKRQGDK